MNKGNSFAKKPKEVTQKSEKKCKEFEAISKFFSKEEWAKLGYSDKITYVYMKRNYDIMTGLGLKTTLPAFMCPKKCATKSSGHDSDEDQDSGNESKWTGRAWKGSPKAQLLWVQLLGKDSQEFALSKPEDVENRLCRMPVGTWEGGGISLSEKNKTKQNRDLYSPTQPTLIYQLFSTIGSKKGKNIWANRLRQRKNLIAYEEISDPEEDD
uniref:KRAB-related domain-containing protein n=1 Tax=Panthera leo TaxID=9689 RepID=A0A8C8XM45_PANLE